MKFDKIFTVLSLILWSIVPLSASEIPIEVSQESYSRASAGLEKPKIITGKNHHCFEYGYYFVQIERSVDLDEEDMKNMWVRVIDNNQSFKCDGVINELDFNIKLTGHGQLVGIKGNFLFEYSGAGEDYGVRVYDLKSKSDVYYFKNLKKVEIDQSNILKHEIEEVIDGNYECKEIDRKSLKENELVFAVKEVTLNFNKEKLTTSGVVRCITKTVRY